MHGDDDVRSSISSLTVTSDDSSTIGLDSRRPTENCAGSSGTHGNYQAGMDACDFTSQPLMTRGDLKLSGRLVQAALATQQELEMLYGIRDIQRLTLNTGLGECLVEQSTSRPDERPALEIFLIAWLLAHEYDGRALRSFAKYCLGGVFP